MEKPELSSMKASFEAFQKIEYKSGDVATPDSPMAPALESGVIDRNGTAVVIVFKSSL